jgi:hypothetical protein
MMNPTEHPEYQRVKQEIMAKLENLPPYMHEGIMEYVMQGRPTGKFLRAVFTNNFNEAVRQADHTNRSFLYEYTELLLVIPLDAWGDAQKVEDWKKSRGMSGLIGLMESVLSGKPDPEPEGGG